jgi:hypothetical protein
MVRNHQEIQRPDQLYRLAGVGDDLLTPGEPEAHMRIVLVSDHAAVHGKRGMVVGIAEVHPLGKMLIHVGGIRFRLFDHLATVRRSRVLGQSGSAQHDEECDVEGKQTPDRLHGSSSWLSRTRYYSLRRSEWDEDRLAPM